MFRVPDLPYEFDALEPAISGDVMRLHHDFHHQAYVSTLNDALETHPELQGRPVESLLRDIHVLPESLRVAVAHGGGGHYNHSLFWQSMSPQGGGEPTGELKQAIVQRYGSIAAFVEEFTAQAKSLFGSGWVWLQPNMDILTTANQDSPLMLGLPEPLFGLDVWEHAYYLDYQNRRADYIDAWWSIVNWEFISSRYES